MNHYLIAYLVIGAQLGIGAAIHAAEETNSFISDCWRVFFYTLFWALFSPVFLGYLLHRAATQKP